MEKFICVFGDSISWGAWDMEKAGWVNRLWLYLANKKSNDYIELYNQSISGGTTDTILKIFESESRIRNSKWLIFQLGGNDASYDNALGSFLVSQDKFRRNIEEIIIRAKKITNNIIFTELENCDETRTIPASWVDISYTNKSILEYISIIKEVCEKNNVLYLDLKYLNNEDFYDGLHPNAVGHEKIFVQVRDFLIKHNWI